MKYDIYIPDPYRELDHKNRKLWVVEDTVYQGAKELPDTNGFRNRTLCSYLRKEKLLPEINSNLDKVHTRKYGECVDIVLHNTRQPVLWLVPENQSLEPIQKIYRKS